MADETEIPWLLAEKLKDRGFSNLYDYFRNEFKDPETGHKPKNPAEFTEYNLKAQTEPIWNSLYDIGGDRIRGWKDFRARGMWNSDHYTYKKRWGGKFKTKTKKFEFYSETLKAALGKHAEKHKTDIDDILKTCNYTASGELAFTANPAITVKEEARTAPGIMSSKTTISEISAGTMLLKSTLRMLKSRD
jgi:hypothetical protein